MSEKLFLDIKFKKFILNDEFFEISVFWGLFERESTPNGECYRYGSRCVIQSRVTVGLSKTIVNGMCDVSDLWKHEIEN